VAGALAFVPTGLVGGLAVAAMAGMVAGGCSTTVSSSSAPGEVAGGVVSTPVGVAGGSGGVGGGGVAGGSTGGFDVAMIGDSITAMSDEQLETAFTEVGFDAAVIDGVPGRRILVDNEGSDADAGVDVLEGMLDYGIDPDVWVIALGTNDVGQYSAEDYDEVVRAMLDLLPDDVPVVWVNAYVGPRLEATDDWNEALEATLGEREHSTVADWFSTVENREDVVLADDRYHPNEIGAQVFADLVSRTAVGAG
jgi:lysophospholipase L1-like esterase